MYVCGMRSPTMPLWLGEVGDDDDDDGDIHRGHCRTIGWYRITGLQYDAGPNREREREQETSQ